MKRTAALLAVLSLGLGACGHDDSSTLSPATMAVRGNLTFVEQTHPDGTHYRCVFTGNVDSPGLWCERIK